MPRDTAEVLSWQFLSTVQVLGFNHSSSGEGCVDETWRGTSLDETAPSGVNMLWGCACMYDCLCVPEKRKKNGKNHSNRWLHFFVEMRYLMQHGWRLTGHTWWQYQLWHIWLWSVQELFRALLMSVTYATALMRDLNEILMTSVNHCDVVDKLVIVRIWWLLVAVPNSFMRFEYDRCVFVDQWAAWSLSWPMSSLRWLKLYIMLKYPIILLINLHMIDSPFVRGRVALPEESDWIKSNKNRLIVIMLLECSIAEQNMSASVVKSDVLTHYCWLVRSRLSWFVYLFQ